MKVKKWVKVVGFIFFCIFLFFGFLIGFSVIDDLKMEKKLEREVEKIQDILDATEFDEEAYKKKLNKTVTTGDYYKVERAYKNYLRDYLKINNSIIEFYENIKIDQLLTIDNIINDGKDFFSTRTILNAYSNGLDTLKNKFDSMSSEKKVLSYLDDSLDDYYEDYYMEIIGDIRQTEEEKSLSNTLSQGSKLLKNTKRIFDYLSDNKNHWTVGDNMILFDSEEMLQEYQSLVAVITNLGIEESSGDASVDV